jgi:hypothetical protein
VPVQWDQSGSTPAGSPLSPDFTGTLRMVTAGSLLVFLRRNIGIRILSLRRFAITWALLIALSLYEHPLDMPLMLFASCVMILVIIHHVRHSKRIHSGTPEWHTYDTGQPMLFGFLPLPGLFVRGVFEPVFCVLFGWWLFARSYSTFYLGLWIMWSALTLFWVERSIRIGRRERLFDLGDTVVESEDFAHRAEGFTDRRPGGGRSRQQAQMNIWSILLRLMRTGVEFVQPGKRKRRKAEEQTWQQQEEHRQEEEATRERQREQQHKEQQSWNDAAAGKMPSSRALEILELKGGATEQEIRAAYSRLMQRVHPDVGGSNFFAKQLNAARDILLGKRAR